MQSVFQQSQVNGTCSSLLLQLHSQRESSVKSERDINIVDDDPENILSDSLQLLYDYRPITVTSAGSLYTYTHPTVPQTTVTLRTPDSEAANWSLHASSVWIASIQLAHNIDLLRLDELFRSVDIYRGEKREIRILELGAAAGLPSILIAKLYPNFKVIATDYPDPQIMHTLAQNIKQNGVEANCQAIPLAWGSDCESLFSRLNSTEDHGFDVIIAADTLWNPSFHTSFISTLQNTLHRDSGSRVHLVAGLHTGRYTIQSFLRAAKEGGFHIVQIVEREVHGGRENEELNTTRARTREWDVTRAEYEEESDRRGWIIWIELAWGEMEKDASSS